MKNKKVLFISLTAVICVVAIALAVYFTLPAKIDTSQQKETSSTSDYVEDNSWKSGTATHEKISNYAETHNDTFSNSYAGLYFDSAGKLNILLTGQKKECNKFILDTFGYENPCKTIVKYSYKELTSEQEKIDNLISDNSKKDNDSVINSVTATALNVLDNNITVTLYTQTGESDEELISKFKEEISDSEMIAFEFTNRKSVNLDN
ncbi:MAG: hypothetical protein K2G22_05285 [Eubacterium sp.]|nr:hypothetical protein [Eubacterium sp.]